MLTTIRKKKIKFKPVLSIIMLFILIGSWYGAKLMWFKPLSINQFYERVVLRYSLLDPQMMTQIGLLDKYHLDYYNDDLTDPSLEAQRKTMSFLGKQIEVLKSYDREKQSKEQLLSTDILAWYMEDAYAERDLLEVSFPVNNYLGAQRSIINFMCNTHKIRDKGDAKDYIERLEKFDDYFDKMISSLKEREAAGVIPPKDIVSGTLSEMQSFVDTIPKMNSLYTSFESRVDALSISEREKESLCKKVEEAIVKDVYPGYRKLIAYYADLLPKAKDYVGIWNVPKGEEYYAHEVKSKTTLDISPEELFNKLQKEVDILNGRLVELDKTGNMAVKTIKDVSTVEDCQKYLDEIQNKLPQIVTKLPKTSVIIKTSPTASNGFYSYYPSDINGSTPAIINVPSEFASDSLYNIKWILYHEGIPGHHLQLSLARELTNVPTFRKVIPFQAFSEGWATYAQHMPWELGLTKDEGIEKDIIKTELFHMGRAAIDLGINYKHWTKEDVESYALKYNITDVAGADSLTGLYTVYPGMGLSYAAGCLKIRELRDYAQKELGAKFDLRVFHDEVLKQGSIPLDILDKQIKAYVNKQLN